MIPSYIVGIEKQEYLNNMDVILMKVSCKVQYVF